MKKEHRERRNGIPLLRSLPLLGYLFGSTSLSEVRSELVVMIKPTLVMGDVDMEANALQPD